MRYTTEKSVTLDVERAWEVFSDTDHFNRFVGLPKVKLEDGAGELARKASGRILGMRLEWLEHPFEWIEGRYFTVTRDYSRGPVSRVVGGIEFRPNGAGALLTFVADVTPRHWWAKPIAILLAKNTLRGFRAYVDKFVFDSDTRQKSAPVTSPKVSQQLEPGPSTRTCAVDEDRLRSMVQKVMKVRPQTQPELARRFEAHLREAGDDQVLRMRPYDLADRWRFNRVEMLEFFLHATKQGLLTLEWELICPNCRVPKSETKTLRGLAPSFHCDLCGISYATDLEQSTELRFSVSAELRSAEDAVFCLGSPARTKHVAAQQYVEPGEERRLKVSLNGRQFRIRSVRINKDCALKPVHARDYMGKNAVDVAYADAGFSAASANFVPGEVDFVIRNGASERRLFVVERVGPDANAVTAAEVTMMQEFRGLFSAEVLAPGQQVGVRSICVLFTDLKASTEIYERVGDASAFASVQKQFDFVARQVAESRGAVIKTIGDAVMAVFPTRRAGVGAAIQMQRRLELFNRENGFDPGFVLKIGLHFGPAIAVNANNVLDYFGRTVNIAARIETFSQGGDVVISDEIAAEPDVRSLLEEAGARLVSLDTKLKGTGDLSFRLWKIEIPSVATTQSAG